MALNCFSQVFEGILADLPFAHFFLAKLLHGHAFLDELQARRRTIGCARSFVDCNICMVAV
jgi:hypothetical protein